MEICSKFNNLYLPLHSVALIWPSEWEIIHKLFVVDNTIKVIQLMKTGETGTVLLEYKTIPGKTISHGGRP